MKAPFVFFAAASVVLCGNEQQPIKIDNRISQPRIGFGTWNLKESADNTSAAVALAIESGYRQIDCAAAYGNEKEVGRGIAEGLKKAGLNREDIWITSKLWNDHHAPDRVEQGLEQTLADLGLEYLDLYLMHWSVGKGPEDKKYKHDYLETWHAMQVLLASGRVRNIGVSNFSPGELEDLIKNSDIKPAVHQMELHPYLTQRSWLLAHEAHGIAITAYSPLGNMNPTYGDRAREASTTKSHDLLLEEKVLRDIGEKRNCTPAQVALAWGMSRGVSVIPKSKHEEYIKENIGALDCVLERDDITEITKLGSTPKRFNNPSQSWGVHLFKGLEDAGEIIGA